MKTIVGHCCLKFDAYNSCRRADLAFFVPWHPVTMSSKEYVTESSGPSLVLIVLVEVQTKNF